MMRTESYRHRLLVVLALLLIFPMFLGQTEAEAQTVGEAMVEEAKKLVGTPYQFGGATPSRGFDTSGLIQYLHSNQDISIPRTVRAQAEEGTKINTSDLQPGDVIFFKDSRGQAEIASLYIGNGQAIGSTPKLNGVGIASITTSAAKDSFLVAKRYFTISEDSNASKDKATIVKGVNFRSAPSTNSTVYGLIPRGTAVTVLEEVNRHWFKIEVNGREGYISAYPQFVDYVSNSDSGQAPAPTPEPAPQPQPESSSIADQIIDSGEKYMGTPYRFGAKSGSGYLDCSLFTQTVFREHDIRLPRSSRQQSQVGSFVKWGEWEKGDLLFFWTRATGQGTVGHVAIYAGDGKILHTWGSPGVAYSDINHSSWKNTYMGAKRVID